MNILEVVKRIKPLQKVSSNELQMTLIMDEDGYRLHYYNFVSDIPGTEFEFTANEWLVHDWELELNMVDFWTAWNARKDGSKIRCALWHKDTDYDAFPSGCPKLSEGELNARWEIR